MTLPSGEYLNTEFTVFRNYYDLYYDSIKRYLYYKTGNNSTVDDIVQEVFIKLWEIRSKVKPDSVKPLLYTIALNLLRNQYKHQKVVYGFEKQNVSITTSSEQADDSVLQDEFNNELNEIIESIPEKSRDVFLMNRIDGLKYNEIAERLGLSVKAIEKRMHEALNIIKQKVKYKI